MASAALSTPTIPAALPAPDDVQVRDDSRKVIIRWALPSYTDDGLQHHAELLCSYRQDKAVFYGQLRHIAANHVRVRHLVDLSGGDPLTPVTIAQEPAKRYSGKRFNEFVALSLDNLATYYAADNDLITRFFTLDAVA